MRAYHQTLIRELRSRSICNQNKAYFYSNSHENSYDVTQILPYFILYFGLAVRWGELKLSALYVLSVNKCGSNCEYKVKAPTIPIISCRMLPKLPWQYTWHNKCNNVRATECSFTRNRDWIKIIIDLLINIIVDQNYYWYIYWIIK